MFGNESRLFRENSGNLLDNNNNQNNKIIMHLDLDAFFASCEEALDPFLKYKPVIIGADPKKGKGRGVVSTANYKAREFGIRSAMPISQAYKRCPQGVFISGNFQHYLDVSARVFSYIAGLGYPFESGGIDEMYLDLSGLTINKSKKLSYVIRKHIYDLEKISCSIGIGPSKVIAKIASDYNKPRGLTIVNRDSVEKFINPLGIRKIPGIGPKTARRLNRIGVKTVVELRKIGEDELVRVFGNSWGSWLFRISRGIDGRSVANHRIRKSIGAERTFMYDENDEGKIIDRLNELIKKIYLRMMVKKLKSKTLVLKIRYENFETHTVQKTNLSSFSNEKEVVSIARYLIRPFLKDKRRIRLVGVRFTELRDIK